MEEEENYQFSKFERADDFLKTLAPLLGLDLWIQPTEEEDHNEVEKFNKLHIIVSVVTGCTIFGSHRQRAHSLMNIKSNRISWIPT